MRGVSLQMNRGQTVGLIGESGCGKSLTALALMGLLPEQAKVSGSIRLLGQELVGLPESALCELRGPRMAMVFQEPMTALNPLHPIWKQIAEPLCLHQKMPISDAKARALELLERVQLPRASERLDAYPHQLSGGQRQTVAIARAVLWNSKVVILDEPTAALSASEVERLMTVMKSLKAANKAVIFVSHRLDEVFAISDFITVMRDGATVSENAVGSTDLQKVIKEMVGRELTELFPKTENKIGEVVLEVKDLTNPAYFRNVSFNVKKGEIVALAGLVGSGRSEVARAIFGVDKYESGSVTLNGKALPAGSPVEAMKRKIALVPEDRRQQGLFMVAGVNRNISMESFDKLTDRGMINFKREKTLTKTWKEKLSIKFANQADPVDRLSGGNQQKTVLAKWLATDPDLLIVDEPTRGIDVATKAEVHRLVNQAASEGKAVLMISSELPEVLGMADRIIVMREGKQVAELSRKEATQEKIIAAATTGKRSA